jgi:hypothetical protein
MADNDTHWRITQNRHQREYGRDPTDLRNIINDKRRDRARTSSPQRCSHVWATTPSGRAAFCALAPGLRQVAWPDKFKPGPINKYNRSNNPEEFIQLYHRVIETVGGDNRVKANNQPMTFTGADRSWLINLPEGTIYKWDQLCDIFIRNFQGTYEHPSTAEKLKTIK